MRGLLIFGINRVDVSLRIDCDRSYSINCLTKQRSVFLVSKMKKEKEGSHEIGKTKEVKGGMKKRLLLSGRSGGNGAKQDARSV